MQVRQALLHRAGIVAVHGAQVSPHFHAQPQRFDIAHRFFDDAVAGVAARCDEADQVANPPAEAPPPDTPPSDTAPPETPSAAPAPYMNDDGEAITNPVWLRAPQPEYPRAAQRAGEESGMARLACQTRADGGIQGCRIVEERPVGVGFGREAVAATMRARVKPRLVDGQPTESQVVFTIRYRLE